MSHLSTDRLAAFADETPTPDEATHLAGCWDCRAEVAAYRRLARLAAMAPVHSEPLTAWSQLAPQLRAEGVIVDAQRMVSPNSGGARVTPMMQANRKPSLNVWVMRLAAGLALLVGGGLVGRATAPSATAPSAAAPPTATSPSPRPARPASAGSGGGRRRRAAHSPR